MRKMMTILAVAALSASTAFAGTLDETPKDETVLAQESGGMLCTNSMVEAGVCAAGLLCLGNLCSGGSSSSSVTTPATSTPASGT